MRVLKKLLNIAGWPGDNSLNSQQYQLHQTMQTCMQEFTSLDYINKILNFKDVFRHLKHHTTNQFSII